MTDKTQTAAADKSATKPAGRTLDEFRKTYDKNIIVPAKVRAALSSLGPRWCYEMELVKLAGVGLADLGAFRSQFDGYFHTLRSDSKRVWSGRKETIAAIKEAVL